MSRTTRRTKSKPDWIYNDECFTYNWKHPAYSPPGSKPHTKRIRRYHSDGWYDENAPKWFRQLFCNRKYRAKMNHETRRILKQGDYEEYSYRINKKDSIWKWW